MVVKKEKITERIKIQRIRWFFVGIINVCVCVYTQHNCGRLKHLINEWYIFIFAYLFVYCNIVCVRNVVRTKENGRRKRNEKNRSR